MQPIVFGNSSRPLFGVLHPAVGKPSDVGVLLLQPGVHEYERAHWAFRSLASSLAARGHHVLRFDYRGTGDSAGEPEEATVEACVEDARTAWQELREVPGVRRASIVGMRLGAAIATMACSPAVDRAAAAVSADDVVLWEPVVRGMKYLAELEALDASMRLRLLHPARRPVGELAGFSFPPQVRASVARVDVATHGKLDARRVLVFVSTADDEILRLKEALERAGSNVQIEASTSESALVRASVRQSAVVPGSDVSQIATRIESAFA